MNIDGVPGVEFRYYPAVPSADLLPTEEEAQDINDTILQRLVHEKTCPCDRGTTWTMTRGERFGELQRINLLVTFPWTTIAVTFVFDTEGTPSAIKAGMVTAQPRLDMGQGDGEEA